MVETNQLDSEVIQENPAEFFSELTPIEIADPVDPIAIIIWAAVTIGIIALLWVLIRKLQAKKKVLQPELPANEKALIRLQEAMNQFLESDPKLFVIEVSNTIRQYLEDRFLISAPELTTEEFLIIIRSDNQLHPQHKQALNEFLNISDLVKFAKLEPNRQQLLELFDTAKEFVQQTTIPSQDNLDDMPKGGAQ